MSLVQWLSAKLGAGLECGIQQWVKYTGKSVEIADFPWLDGPIGTKKIGSEVYEGYARTMGMEMSVNAPGSGLLAQFCNLSGGSFAGERIDQEIRAFYERTVDYTLDVWSQWHGILQCFAKGLVAFVSRQIQQFNLPLSSLETSHGITSDIVRMVEKDTGYTPYAGWLRTIQSTGAVVYAGFYTTCTPASCASPCVKVVFPLPGGSATVLLKPENQPDGSFKLVSSGNGFGSPGYYRIHRVNKTTMRVKYLPLKEVIHVYRDNHNTLRADHTFMFAGLKFLTLHYKICPKRQ